jgi:galactitol-specific phosphotransferase system IIB component
MIDPICDALNMRSLEDALKDSGVDPKRAEESTKEIEEMANALEKITPSELLANDESGIKDHEKEMNEIYHQALKAHKELLDLGFNIEAKHAGTIFEPAARFLETAMNASKSKNDQKLKVLKLKMDREKLDNDLKKNVQEGELANTTEDPGFIADRNALLRDLRERLQIK